MDNIIVVGSSGQAKAVIDIVEQQNSYAIVGLLDSFRPIGEETLGYSILGAEDDLPALVRQHDLAGVIVAIGDNHARAAVAARIALACPQLRFVNAVHPNASIGKAVLIGEGTVVMAGAVLGPCCQLGRLCIVNTKASLDHDSVMSDFSSLAPGVTTGGYCRIGSYTAVGIGAVVFDRVVIGEHSVIGGGAVVLHAVEAFCVSYGVPAKKVRDRQAGDRYL
ncbi:acetyltransferase [Janthinobacterium fluminis]|uniref:Acetyltransferase n=1 Tax=Janthinobacterium fluminis TaxID=2987524 RepID=A0ABT5JUV2_9BURK|nr:acetyltransferase [Janthinobacterium fluminis]MDC8756512.1 acetyltransferase [Janthinobacterium fluminis]